MHRNVDLRSLGKPLLRTRLCSDGWRRLAVHDTPDVLAIAWLLVKWDPIRSRRSTVAGMNTRIPTHLGGCRKLRESGAAALEALDFNDE